MLIRIRQGWELPESAATPEEPLARLGRRALLAGAGAIVAGGLAPRPARAEMNPRFADAGRPITPEREATTYNNYYEFGSQKEIADAAQHLPLSPWTLRVEGMVKQPRSWELDDLLKQVRLEDRVYRHRCVEAWSMVVPWTGFPLRELVRLAEPLGSARYLRFETAADLAHMPGLRQSWYPWPYVEGLTMEEAGNELSFLVTGMYGKRLPPQNGGPIRLHLPWKYGFKSAKSLVKVTFTDKRPVSFWEQIQPNEYGFWANVNPAVPHPRWSQATERVLGTGERVPTVIYNGYGEWVAGLYTDKTNEKLFM